MSKKNLVTAIGDTVFPFGSCGEVTEKTLVEW